MFSGMQSTHRWTPEGPARPDTVLLAVGAGLALLWVLLIVMLQGSSTRSGEALLRPTAMTVCVPAQQVLDAPNGAVVGHVNAGDKVVVSGTRDGWSRIDGEAHGWVPEVTLCSDPAWLPLVPTGVLVLDVESDRFTHARVTIEGPAGRVTDDVQLPMRDELGRSVTVPTDGATIIRVSAVLPPDAPADADIRCAIRDVHGKVLVAGTGVSTRSVRRSGW